jgi:hypothetical protein
VQSVTAGEYVDIDSRAVTKQALIAAQIVVELMAPLGVMSD